MRHSASLHTLLAALLASGVWSAAAEAQRCDSLYVRVVGAVPSQGLPLRVSDSAGLVLGARQVLGEGTVVIALQRGAEEGLAELGDGLTVVRRRLPLTRGANPACGAVLAVASGTTELAAVRVVAKREAPRERFVTTQGTGAAEQVSDGASAALPPAEAGIGARARTQLQTLNVGGRVSLAGLSPNESQQRLNGMVNGARTLPRTLPVYQRVGTGAYDIVTGGFSGAAVDLEVARASEIADLRAEVMTSGAPTDIKGAGGSAANVALDLGGEWRPVSNRHGISVGLRGAMAQSPYLTFQGASPDLRAANGFAARSADSLLSLLATRSPELAGAAPTYAPTSWTTAAVVRVDPFIAPGGPGKPVIGSEDAIVLAAEADDQAPMQQTVGNLASIGQRIRRTAGSLMWQRQIVQGVTRLDLRAALRGEREAMASAAGGYAGIDVPLSDPATDERTGARATFGGLPNRERTGQGLEVRGIMTRNLTKAMLTGLVAVRSDRAMLRREGAEVSATLPSIGELSAGNPSLIRVLPDGGRQEAGATRFAAGVGLQRSFGPRLQGQAGLRADAQRMSLTATSGSFTAAAPFEAPVPRLDLSPRIGLTWLAVNATDLDGIRRTDMWSRHLMPTGQLRLGVGRFVADAEPGDLLASDRPVGWTREVECTDVRLGGLSTPRYLTDALTSMCNGTLPTATSRLSGARPAPGYRSPYAWRATAAWVGHFAGLDYTVDALQDEGFAKLSVEDANLALVPALQAGPGGDRPVFALPALRDPRTGDWLPTAGRADPQVGKALVFDAAGRTRISQVAVSISPLTGDSEIALRLGYVWQRSLAFENGWTADTDGDPRAWSWGPARNSPRHQVQLELGHTLIDDALYVSLWVRARSGLPFTPIIAGDVNADGVSGNDRAFVPDWRAPDASAEVRTWSGALPARAVRCLDPQRGSIAARGSCSGPWTASSNLDLLFGGMLSRMQVRLTVENLGGALEQLLRLPAGRLLGGAPLQDVVLGRVQPGAGAATPIALNPHFGQQVPIVAGISGGWRLTLSVTRALSPPVQRQQLTRWLALKGVGERMPVDTLAWRFSRNVAHLYASILETADELGLDDDQRRELEARRVPYDRSRDSIWYGLAERLYAMPRRIAVDSALPILQAATDAAWDLSWVHARALASLLSPIQQRLLPWPASALITANRRPKFEVVYY